MTRNVSDSVWLERALRLAERGWGRVQPNPLVGAIVLDAEGQVIAQSYHARYGEGHAEARALESAGAAARGGTLYVTLEPCNHFGRTPPCTDAILRAGIARVVYGARDPNPTARGGAERLRSAGVNVDGPIAEADVRAQNAIFFNKHELQRTFVALKLAATLDGRIAEAPGVRTTITGPRAQRETQRLRAGFDGIMVGIGTVLADDPLLTVRGRVVPTRLPVRVVLDSDARLPAESRLVHTIEHAPVWLFCTSNARTDHLERVGVRVFRVGRAGNGLDLNEVLAALWDAGIHSVFCEGGAQVAGGLAAAGRIDRLYLFLAPRLLGSSGLSAFADFLPGSLAHLAVTQVRRLGADALITCDRGSPEHSENPGHERQSSVHGIG